MCYLEREEDQLRQKISSKMTVSTLLAGFNFTALTLVLTFLSDGNINKGNSINLFTFNISSSSLLEITSMFLLLSVALFVAAIFCYDRLLMPRNYWFPKYNNSKVQNFLFWFIEKVGHPPGNRVYVNMLSTWYIIFIPATLFSTIGILLLFYTFVQMTIFIISLICVILVLIYYSIFKPKLGVD